MVAAYFDSQGLIYTDAVPKGQTINSDFFCQSVLRFLRRYRLKRPGKTASDLTLHFDNARPHVSKATKDFLASKSIKTIDHPPYSPDLAPVDFWLFPLAKKKMAGKVLEDEEDALKEWYGVIQTIPKKAFAAAFQSWIKRWNKCKDLDGDYVEK